MDAEKFTKKSLEVIENCSKLAYEYNNQEIDQEHLLLSMVTTDDCLIGKLLDKMGIDLKGFTSECERAVAYRPKVTGTSDVYMSREFTMTLMDAENESKQMGDAYISVEHIFLAMIKKANKAVREIFQKYGITRDGFLKTLATVRGNQKVETDNPEATYDSLSKYGYDLVERARLERRRIIRF